MNMLHIANLDLNLLRVFDALLQERSVSRAGSRLGLSQSAVSHALRRLRDALSDELFRRGPAGMQPTPRALEIGPALHAALLQVQAALAPRGFDPATVERRFNLIAGPYICAVLMPTVTARLRERAPKAELRITGYGWDSLDALEVGRADAAVGGFYGSAERFSSRRLFEESLVWVVRAGHPIAAGGGAVSLKALAEVEHVSVDYPKADTLTVQERQISRRSAMEDPGVFERELVRHGLARKIGVVTPDSHTALAIVACSDMATLAPRRLVEQGTARGRLQILEPPYSSPPLEIGVIALRDRETDPAQIWLLDLLAEAARSL